MSDISYYTPEGFKNLKEELDHLESVERPRVTQEIADARDKGDLSENAEYHAAKEEQSHLEFKIANLKMFFLMLELLMNRNWIHQKYWYCQK